MSFLEEELEEYPIVHFRLVDGEELISFVEGSTETGNIYLSNPMRLNIIAEKNDHITYYFSRYCPFSIKDEVCINSTNIISYTPVTEAIEERYVQAVLRYKEQKSSTKVKHDQDKDSGIMIAEVSNTYH